MQERELKASAETGPILSRQAVERQAEEPAAQGILSPQRDPLAQVTCRAGDASCASAHASTLNRATDSQPAHAGQSFQQLQRQYGNRYVQRVLAQARTDAGEASAAPEVERAIQQARGGGQALDSGVRAQMEPALGADFSGVRVHADAGADDLNRSLNARAFTTGQDIFFRQGAYSPGSSSGRELVAHELTHVVQQNGDWVRTKLTVGQPGDRYEQEADEVARATMQRQQQVAQRSDNGGFIRRQVEEEEEEEPIQVKVEDSRIPGQVEAEEEEEEPIQAKIRSPKLRRQVRRKKELLVHSHDHGASPVQKGFAPQHPIQRWGGGDHQRLTRDNSPGWLPRFLKRHLAGYSADMDWKLPELWFNIPTAFKDREELPEYYRKNPNRALNHGEGGLYTITSRAQAASWNKKRQGQYEKEARQAAQRAAGGGRLWWVGALSKLGDALHVAQDRGSHVEGLRDRGHHDPRVDQGWDTDSPKDNSTGYIDAGENTKQVFSRASKWLHQASRVRHLR